jgi:hypothetical protein
MRPAAAETVRETDAKRRHEAACFMWKAFQLVQSKSGEFVVKSFKVFVPAQQAGALKSLCRMTLVAPVHAMSLDSTFLSCDLIIPNQSCLRSA